MTEDYDRLWKFYNEISGSPESSIDSLQDEIPEVLRFLAEDMREHQPHAKNEIRMLEDTADFLVHLDLSSDEGYWERRERLEEKE